jgi:hypothetical protein
MPSSLSITWLTCTWNRPRCLRNLVRQFLAQDYPKDQLSLLILDDAGQYHNQGDNNWQLISFNRRFFSLAEKYNALLGMVNSDIVVIAEDDDLYSPLHTKAHATALELSAANTSKPSRVKVQYGPEHEESDPGRFHASMAIEAGWLRSIGGWGYGPDSMRADFDLQLIAKLREKGTIADPCSYGFEPTYTFTWETSGHYHAQAYGTGPGDKGFYGRAALASGPVEFVGDLFS